MKKALVLFSIVLLASCANKKEINGVVYRPYGIFNESQDRNDSIEYQVSGLAIFSGIVWSETIVVPIYTFGFNLFEPVSAKSKPASLKGVIN